MKNSLDCKTVSDPRRMIKISRLKESLRKFSVQIRDQLALEKYSLGIFLQGHILSPSNEASYLNQQRFRQQFLHASVTCWTTALQISFAFLGIEQS